MGLVALRSGHRLSMQDAVLRFFDGAAPVKTPTSKHQAPENIQHPTKLFFGRPGVLAQSGFRLFRGQPHRLELAAWSFSGAWMLVLGASARMLAQELVREFRRRRGESVGVNQWALPPREAAEFVQHEVADPSASVAQELQRDLSHELGQHWTQSGTRPDGRPHSARTKLLCRPRGPDELSRGGRSRLGDWLRSGGIGLPATARSVQTQRPILEATGIAASGRLDRSPPKWSLGSLMESLTRNLPAARVRSLIRPNAFLTVGRD
jgi:hypothetical protein